jgi:hypothetical protein
MGKLIDYRVAGMVLAVAGAFSTQACNDSPLGDNELLKQCGLVCSDKGIVEGNASISGIANVDAFFGSVVNFNAKANLIAGNINAELGKVYASVGAKGAADFQASLQAKFMLDGDVAVKFQPAQCAVSAKATIEATAKCDATIDPGKAEVTCSGSCEAEASVDAKCDASATVKCVGTAPSLKCEGECKGSCQLDAAASCEGTCNGDCSGTCSVKNADGSCAGKCDGMCKGNCQLEASGSCSGSCKGECTYTPPDAKCEAGASVKCEAKANATVKCDGKCDGEVTPPKASAECEASAKADASVNVECTPPSVDVSYKFAAGADAMAQAKFEAWLVGFKASMGFIGAQVSQSKFVLKAGGDIAAKATGAVHDAVAAIDIKGNLKASVGVTCAVAELPKVADAMAASTKSLTASAKAAGELTAAIGG